jgi:hypothetical protein
VPRASSRKGVIVGIQRADELQLPNEIAQLDMLIKNAVFEHLPERLTRLVNHEIETALLAATGRIH